MSRSIVIVDILSHANMHLPFNEGYIKSMRKAFPEDEIIFAGSKNHVGNLKQFIEPEYEISFKCIKDFQEQLGTKSYHNPFYAIPASRRSWNEIMEIVDNKDVRNISFLGANGPLISTFSKKGKALRSSSIHYIQHNQLSTSMRWRSKNPFFKYFDYLSVVGRGLPKNQRLILLELGLEQVLVDHAPKIEPCLETIEHPVQEREYMPPKPVDSEKPINIAFLGNCGVGKGFDTFLRVAKKFSGDKYNFYAIGKNNISLTGDLSFDGLKTLPADGHLPREDFVALLAKIDMVFLPLPKTTSYVSSGSIIDAFASSKPLIISSNQSVREIERKYGEYGITYSTLSELESILIEFNAEKLESKSKMWQENINKIRQARSESGIAKQLRDSILV